MRRFFKISMCAAAGIFLLIGSFLTSVSAQSVSVSLPTFKITMNDISIDNSARLYPLVVYKDITYIPMTYNDSRFLGLETKWSADSGLEVNKISNQIAYKPDTGVSSSSLESATLPGFRIRVNAKDIDNGSEPYPLLVFRDITYFPLTWRYMVDEFGWTSNFDTSNGLVVNSKPSKTAPITSNTGNNANPRNFAIPEVSCLANQPIETYPDGKLKQCTLAAEKSIAGSQQGTFSVSQFVCAKGSPLGVYPDGKVSFCTPIDHVFMRGKGTCHPGQRISLQPDGKVQECTYTYPLYQNNSCKPGEKVSFHTNGNFSDCILPAERVVANAVCKADSPVSYYPDGSISKCTLAQPVVVSSDVTFPADSTISFDERQKIMISEKKPTM